MTATWMVLLYSDEGFWSMATPEIKDQIRGEHRAYAAACSERGHKILGGSELGFSSKAYSTRRSDDGTIDITRGPYSETAEYLGGYYVVETDDPCGLARLTSDILVTDNEGGVEVRPVVQYS